MNSERSCDSEDCSNDAEIYLWHQYNFKILQDPKALNVSVFDVLCVYLCPHLFPREHTQFFQELVDVSIQSTAFYWCFSGPVDGSTQWINHQTENLLLCLEKYLNPMTRHRPSAYLIRDARYLTISCYCQMSIEYYSLLFIMFSSFHSFKHYLI